MTRSCHGLAPLHLLTVVWFAAHVVGRPGSHQPRSGSCSAPLWSPRGVMSCFATCVRGALGSQTLLQVSVTTRSTRTCRAHSVLQHCRHPTFVARSRSARARTLHGIGAPHAHARGQSTCPWPGAFLPVCAGSCARAGVGASGEHRAPSGRLLSYLCGSVYFFGVVVWFHVFSTRSNFQL